MLIQKSFYLELNRNQYSEVTTGVNLFINAYKTLVFLWQQWQIDCQVCFHDGRGLDKKPRGRTMRPIDTRKHESFLKLFDHCDKHQFSIREFVTLVK